MAHAFVVSKKNMKFVLSLLILFTTAASNAQDVIYKKDKTKIDGKVLEVGAREVKYKNASNIDGPIYVLSKAEIAIIIYQNGTTDIFSTSENTVTPKFDSMTVNFNRNFMGVDVAEFISNSIGMIYEHTFGKKGMTAVRIPFSVGFGSNSNTYIGYPKGKTLNTGFDFLYFPIGQGALRYYAAIYFECGIYRDRYYTGWYPQSSIYRTSQHLAGGIKNGILYQPTEHFSFSADLGFGIVKNPANYSGSVEPHFKGNVIIGYRFQ